MIVQEYIEFFRKYGIRNPHELARPRHVSIDKLILPKNSAIHFPIDDSGEIGPSETNEYIGAYGRSVYLKLIENVSQNNVLGVMSVKKVPMLAAVHEYFNAHNTFHNLDKNKNAIHLKTTLLSYDYSLIHVNLVYRQNHTTEYMQWHNTITTTLDTIHNLVKSGDTRNHFLEFIVPERINPVSTWMLLSEDIKTRKPDVFGLRFRREVLNRMTSDESKFFAQLWILCGNKDEHTKGFLNQYPIETMDKINLIIRAGNKFTILNLGIFISWLKRDNIATSKKSILVPMVARKRLMALLITMNKARSLLGTEEEDVIQEEEDDQGDEVLNEALDSPDARKQIDIKTSKVKAGEHQIKIDQTVINSKEIPVVPVDNNGVISPDDSLDKRKAENVAITLDEEIDKDLEQLEFIDKQMDVEELYTKYTAYEPPSDNPIEAAIDVATTAAQKGQLTAAEFRRLANKAERFTVIPNPFDDAGTFAEGISYKPEDLAITKETRLMMPKIKGVIDASMLSSSLNQLNTGYVKKQLNKDIGQVVLNIQKVGIILDDYKIREYEDLNDCYTEHTFKLIPVRGQPSTCRFRIPKVNPDGTFKAGGVKYNMRRQRGDYPIHKVKPDEVSLTSYYSKIFVRRAERRTFNYEEWLANEIRTRGIDPDDTSIVGMELGNVYARKYKGSRVYSALSKHFISFVSNEWQFRFNYTEMNTFFGNDIPKGYTAIAKSSQTQALLLLNDNSELFVYNPATKEQHEYGSIESVLRLNAAKAPIDMAEVGLFGKNLPLGMLLAYQIGLGNLLETVKAKYRTVKRGSQLKLNDFEFAVRFEDESLIFDKRQKVVALLMSGFNRFHRDIKTYPRLTFDKKDVYGAVFDNNDISSRRLKECEILFPLWVDPMTKDILLERKMPTDLFSLFLEATKLLTNDEYPEPLERDKGYERFAGFVYQELIKSLRGYQSKPNSANAEVTINPYSVYMNILQDQTVSPSDDSNPYQALKDNEVIVYRGAGGRTSRSMTNDSRTFTERSMGVVSEATVDNGDVGTIAYTSADPNYTSLRGTTSELENLNETAKILSTSTLMAPAATKDDPKRINFTNIQNSQTTHAVGYTPVPVRTGYERVMAHRTPDLYATTAKIAGTVKEINDKNIVIENEDGTAVAVELGRRYGKWSGKVIPHDVITNCKIGDKLDVGDVIAYNTNFFQQDVLDPKQVIYKPGAMARVVLWESTGTLEDSCGLSREFTEKLGTITTHVRYVRVNFNQEVSNLVKLKEKVEPESILCTLYEPVGNTLDIYEGNALNTLQDIGQLNPKAEYLGTVEKIEVMYCGEMDEMSETLRALADSSDTRLYKQRKQMRQKAIDGSVESGFRIDGTPVVDGTAVIAIYITGTTGMGIGDKLVFAHQLKSVVGNIHQETYTSEDGKPIDAEFGYLSVMNRIVNSVNDVGTTNTLLMALSDAAVAAYDNGKQKG